jgi:hypothetical protein
MCPPEEPCDCDDGSSESLGQSLLKRFSNILGWNVVRFPWTK